MDKEGTDVDPNLGLTPISMKPLYEDEKQIICNEWKTITHFKDLPTAVLINNESHPVILLLGGIDLFNPQDHLTGASILLYDVENNQFKFTGTMPEPRNYHASIFLNDHIYVVGGYSPFHIEREKGLMKPTKTIFQMKLKTKKWKQKTDMHVARVYHGAVGIDDRIFVLGGIDESGHVLDSVEVFHIATNQWTFIRKLSEPLLAMGATCVDGIIYIAGGWTARRNFKDLIMQDKVSCYDTINNNWLRKPSLPHPYAFCSMITVKREIWLCGGMACLNSDQKPRSSSDVLVFAPDSTKWEKRTNLSQPRHATAVAKADGCIYVIGGMSDVTGEPLKSTDIIYNETDVSAGCPLPQVLAGCSAVSIPKYYSKSRMGKKPNIGDERAREIAAAIIQRTYRKHLKSTETRSQKRIEVKKVQQERKQSTVKSHSRPKPKSKLMLPTVSIPGWPPTPDPTSSSCTLSTVVTPDDSSIEKHVRRFHPISHKADPNIGLCLPVDDLYAKTKKVLGLRRAENKPEFASSMRKINKLQEENFPVILTIGGLNPREPLNCAIGRAILRYNPLNNRWGFCGIMPEARNHHAALLVNDTIFVTGGYNPDKRMRGEMISSKSMFTLTVTTKEWKQKSDMICSRAHHGMVHFKGNIYVIGGRDESGRLVSSIEGYNISANTWTKKISLLEPRMGTAVVAFRDHIWILGGITERQGNTVFLGSVVRYDPESNTLTNGPELKSPRAFFSAFLIEGRIWIIGGATSCDDDKWMISVPPICVYDPEKSIWKEVAVLKNPRHSAAITSVGPNIYVLGGVSSQEWRHLSKSEVIITEDCEIYNLKDLPIPLTGMAAITLPPVYVTFRNASLTCLIREKLS